MPIPALDPNELLLGRFVADYYQANYGMTFSLLQPPRSSPRFEIDASDLRLTVQGKEVQLEGFEAVKFATDIHMIPLHFSREAKDHKIEQIDLFRDLVSDGKLAVSVQCLEYGQCFGMAQPEE